MGKINHFKFLTASVVSLSLLSGQVLAQVPPAAAAPAGETSTTPAAPASTPTAAPVASTEAASAPQPASSPAPAQAAAQAAAPVAAPGTEPAPVAATATAPAKPADNSWEQEFALWQAASSGNTIEEYNGYLAAYPDGKFAAIAKARVVKMSVEATETVETNTAPEEPAAPALSLGTPETEAVLLAERATRREVQGRLTALGFSTGGTDGVLGAKSRTAISQWQGVVDAPVTGYLAYDQLAKLRTDSEQPYQSWLASRPKVAAPSRPRPAPGDKLVGRVEDNSGADAAIALGVLGLAAGVIGGAAMSRHHYRGGPRFHGGPGRPFRHHR